MKYVLSIFTAIVLIGTTTAQSLKTEKCNWQDCVLMPYTDTMPQDLTTVSLQSIHTGRKVTQLSELSEKEIKKIKKSMRAFKSCTAYIDLEHVLIDNQLNPGLSDSDLSYMIVLETEKK